MPTDNKANEHESTEKVVDTAAKGAAEYFAPGVGGKVYDMAKKTPIVGNRLNNATQRVAKKMDRVPGVQGLSQGLNNSGALNAMNQGINLMGKNPGMQSSGMQPGQKEVAQSSGLGQDENTVPDGQAGVEKQSSTPLLHSKNKKSNQNSQKETPEGTLKKIKKYKMYAKIGCGALGCLGVLFVIVFIVVALKYVGDLFNIDRILGNIASSITDFADNVGNFFSGCGFANEEKCLVIQRDNFFKEVEKVHKTYRGKGITLDSALIVATLTYKDMNTMFGEEEFDYEQDLDEFISSSTSSATDYRKMKNNIATLARHMVKNEDGRLYLDLDKYKKYLLDDFIPNYYYPNEDKTKIQSKISQTVEDIYNKKAFYQSIVESMTELKTIAAMCASGITVIDSNGEIVGNYDLETYVAGVISGEAYSGYPDAAYQVQAIASRTYALYYTNNCTQPIVNTALAQAFKEDIREDARKGAMDTAGLVLTYNGSIFASQYDSFCYDDQDCPDSKYDELTDTFTVTYTRLPDKSTHQITLSGAYKNMVTHGMGHAHGMSQLKSYEMANNGDDYETILKYFYSDGVEIRQMNSIFGNIGHENDIDGQIQVIDGIFHLPKDSQGNAGKEGTQGSSPIYNAGYNKVFEARLEAFRLAAQQAGYKITIPTGKSGAWRPYEKQAEFYNCYQDYLRCVRNGSDENRCHQTSCNNGNSASQPGYGQHGWGIAADLGFNGSFKAIEWAHANAEQFGLHFPVKSENWHIEPIEIVRDL